MKNIQGRHDKEIVGMTQVEDFEKDCSDATLAGSFIEHTAGAVDNSSTLIRLAHRSTVEDDKTHPPKLQRLFTKAFTEGTGTIVNTENALNCEKLTVVPEVVLQVDNPLINAKEEGIVKEQIIVYPEMVTVGKDWITVRALKCLRKFNFDFWDRLKVGSPRIAHLTWYLLVLVGYEIFYFWYLLNHLYNSDEVLNVVVVFLIILATSYIICGIVQIYYVCLKVQLGKSCGMIYAWICLLYGGLSIYASVIIFIYEADFIWAFPCAVIFLMFLEILNLAIWAVIGALAVAPLLAETVVRAIRCDLDCPHQENKRVLFRYRAYKMGSRYTVGETKCPICLGCFLTPPDKVTSQQHRLEDELLCVSQCKANHVFHEKCIFKWLQEKLECPVCRGTVNLRLD